MAFDHRAAGTPEAVWRDAPQWARLPHTGVPGHVERLVVLSAHPDDETLGAGGLIALAAAAGLEVDVVVATDGSASHPGSPTHTPGDLATLRAREVADALAVLAPEGRLHLLGLRDGALTDDDVALTNSLVEVVGSGGVRCLLVCPWVGDRHPDHEAAARASARAGWRTDAQVWQVPLWAWSWGDPDTLPWDSAHLVALPPVVRRAKTRALAQHRSQTEPLSGRPGDEALLNPEFLDHFDRDVEFFIALGPDRGSPFDALHTALEDPWRVASSWYEARKRAVSLACLPHARYPQALDVGSSIGVLSADLATRCDHLLTVDESSVAVDRARATLAGHDGVQVRRLDLPEQWPDGSFDLVVVSETGYFLSPGRLATLTDRISGSLAPGGVVLACHWRHEIRGWPMDGPEVHHRLQTRLGLRRVVQHEDQDFVLDVWVRDLAGQSPS